MDAKSLLAMVVPPPPKLAPHADCGMGAKVDEDK